MADIETPSTYRPEGIPAGVKWEVFRSEEAYPENEFTTGAVVTAFREAYQKGYIQGGVDSIQIAADVKAEANEQLARTQENLAKLSDLIIDIDNAIQDTDEHDAYDAVLAVGNLILQHKLDTAKGTQRG